MQRARRDQGRLLCLEAARPLRARAQGLELCALIGRIFKGSRETYGVPRIHAELADEHDIHVARKRVARLMRRLGIEGVSRRGRRPVTTTQANEPPVASDLVRRRFQAPGPDRLWVADIERHEALLNRAAVKDRRPWPVAAGRVKLGAA